MTERRPLAVARLRPRLVATFALVAAVTAVAVAVTSFLLVRRAVLDRAGDDARRAARSALAEGVEALPPGVSQAEVTAFVNRLVARTGGAFEVVTVMPDGTADTTSISASAASVPAELMAPVASGRVASVRTDVAGRPRIVVGGQVPDTVNLFFFFPLDDIDRDLGTLRTVLAGVAVALVVLSAVVGAVAARALLTPLRRARRAVHRLEVGLLETRLPVAGSDEFADLAESFNRMAAALERTVADLRALEASQRRFVADVSHELRTPLTALTTAADVLEAHNAGLDETGQRAARLLVVESRRLAGLVEDLMEISRLDAGAAAMAWEDVDVGALVTGAHRSRGWTERVEVGLEPGVVIAADPRRLDAVVGNLVGNALEHGRPPVRLTLRADDDAVRLEVADGGPGIAPEHLASVFERFYKADPSRPRSAGSGLGLAIARENARLHGGDVTVSNRPGAGAVFTVVLPRHPSAASAPGAVPVPPVAELLPAGDDTVTMPGHDGRVGARKRRSRGRQ
ncbi:MAG: two-component system, OmpR family, sensor histidine kinase MtrB [Actinomycetota bacterium]|nr:two-component system, OmpR family, sensor histidine kinase MtrB [Actinomycetota bacterium]